MPGNFRILTKEKVLSYTHIRKMETKLGEIIACCPDANADFEACLKTTTANYVVIGIPEDAGVRANFGIGGTETAWPAFLKSFLNIQSNRFLSGKEIFLGGYFDFSKELNLVRATAPDKDEKIVALRTLVGKIDGQVEEIIKIISRQGKIPVIIGGGHNNAYGAIKGAAKGLYASEKIPLAQVSAINLDAHTDYRPREGRHSGNGFRYADADGYLNKYFVIGAHENYLQENVIDDIKQNLFVDYISFEDIFLREKMNFIQAVAHATGYVEDNYTGIELDLDAIKNTLSSAETPCGITTLEARKFLNFVATECKIAYLHICEGAVSLNDDRTDPGTGKLISYLVSDFIKSHFGANQNGLD